MQALLVGGHVLFAALRSILGRDRSPRGHVVDYSFWVGLFSTERRNCQRVWRRYSIVQTEGVLNYPKTRRLQASWGEVRGR